MNWRTMAQIVALGAIGVWPAAAQIAGFGRTIAGVTAGRDNLERVRSLYGPGAENIVDSIRSVCYHFEQPQAYLSLSTFERRSQVRSIVLTTFTSVDPGCHDIARGAHQPLTGPGGIKLGDTMKAVIAAIGKPSATGTLPTGNSDLLYADYSIAGAHATCEFANDKLVLIGIELE